MQFACKRQSIALVYHLLSIARVSVGTAPNVSSGHRPGAARHKTRGDADRGSGGARVVEVGGGVKGGRAEDHGEGLFARGRGPSPQGRS